MNILTLELATGELQAQADYYSNVLGLSISRSAMNLDVQAGETTLAFRRADAGFDGAYHFAFNIPENQFPRAKAWIASHVPLLRDDKGNDEFSSSSWNATSLYFKDAAGNILEFIARHALKNSMDGDFNSSRILNVSEIGLPSEDVIAFADEICGRLGVSVFHQKPTESFTPVGDDDGLLILPAVHRIWYPNTGVPAKLLPVRLEIETGQTRWEIRGMPYQIMPMG